MARKVNQEGQKVQKASDLYRIAVSTIRYIFKAYESNGTLAVRKRGGNQQMKLTDEFIQRM